VRAPRARVAEVLARLTAPHRRHRAAGHRYLLGDTLTALDIYTAISSTPIAGVT
jgi:glutathione S-transferase